MKKKAPPTNAELRVLAEEWLARQTPPTPEELRRLAEEARAQQAASKAADTQHLLHELQVHQIELEMQNQALLAARAETEASLAHYSELYDFAPTGYLTLGADSAIRQINFAAANLLGLERGKLIGRRLTLFVDEADRPAFLACLRRTFASEAKASCEVALCREGAAARPVLIEAIAGAGEQTCRATVVDMAEHRLLLHTQRQLAQAAIDWEAVFNHVREPIFLHDRELRVTQANPAYVAKAGRPLSAIIGQPYWQIFPKLDLPLRGCVSLCGGKELIQLANGEVYQSQSYPVSDGQGEYLYSVHVMQDFTQQAQNAQALQTLNDTLAQSIRTEVAHSRETDLLLIQQSRLATMGEMICNIAHQWRQPLNALALTLTNIEDAKAYGELTDAYLSAQIALGNRLIQQMSATIDDFKQFFQPSKQAQDFSAHTAIDTAVALVAASFRSHGIEITRTPGADILLQGYANEFSQVLLNLLANAKDALLSQHVSAGRVVIGLSQDGEWATLTVADNGGGIPEAILGRIFDPYFSTKELGSGIGLYMSKMIMEKSMHGQIHARNLGDGAEISLRCRVARAT